MSEQTYDIELAGCSPIPLAHYLKALGVLRLVAEQTDPNAKGWWQNDRFWLRSKLDRDALVKFFLDDYAPTPMVGPWGARSGFFSGSSERSARVALDACCSSLQLRLAPFKQAILETRQILEQLCLTDKAESDEDKLALLRACRNQLSDEVLRWLDAVFVLTNEMRAFPPLLGTGGNEGSGSYMSGFAQQVVAVIEERKWDHAIFAGLFAESGHSLNEKQTPGHFFPDAAGGSNAGTGFDGSSGINPWDYLLTLEGALLFAATSAKRLEDHGDGTLAFPFCVRPAGVGFPSADISEEASTRAEMWLPVWNLPAGLNELVALFGEGRGTVNQRKARTGVDFARAISTLGVDRGISMFCRFGFQQRNGLSNFAIPLGMFHVTGSTSDSASLLAPLDRWLDRFRRAATGKTATARAGRALRQVESAIMQLCQRGNEADVQGLLIALGEAEAAVAISKSLREGNMGSGLSPVPLLSKQWVLKANDNSPEFRLAASLASIYDNTVGPFRRHLEPIDLSSKKFTKWDDNTNDPSLVWGSSSLVKNMTQVFQRRLIDLMKSGKEKGQSELRMPLKSSVPASLGDISKFINNELDDAKIEALLKGLILVDWSASSDQKNKLTTDEWVSLQGPDSPVPDAAYALLKLCHLPKSFQYDDHKTFSIRLEPQISRRAIAHDLSAATKLAARRLRVSGLFPAVSEVYSSGNYAQRTVAALLFPISDKAASKLVKRVIRQDKLLDQNAAAETDTATNV